MFGTVAAFVGLSPDDAGGGQLSYLFGSIMQEGGNNIVKGGFVNLPIALARYLQYKGGELITSAGVSKIILKEGRAIEIRLDNEKEIGV
jgi:phytoene dehydrogenase-like protein